MSDDAQLELIRKTIDQHMKDMNISMDDQYVIRGWMQHVLLTLLMTGMPLMHSKFPEALRILATSIELCHKE